MSKHRKKAPKRKPRGNKGKKKKQDERRIASMEGRRRKHSR